MYMLPLSLHNSRFCVEFKGSLVVIISKCWAHQRTYMIYLVCFPHPHHVKPGKCTCKKDNSRSLIYVWMIDCQSKKKRLVCIQNILYWPFDRTLFRKEIKLFKKSFLVIKIAYFRNVQFSCCPLRALNWSINWIEYKWRKPYVKFYIIYIYPLEPYI